MSILTEFKAFIAKGNVMDLAVGVLIGAAFGSVVKSLTEDVITPIIALCGGGKLNFSQLAIGGHHVIDAAGKDTLVGGIMVGNFINAVINFLILAFVVFFLFVKPMNKLMSTINKPPPPPPAPTTPEDVLLLREIRDSLKAAK